MNRHETLDLEAGMRKNSIHTHETLNSEAVEGMGNEEGGRFFACYLLCSLNPRYKGHTYIGFTVNPRRRIRQHNGEITSGAWRTKCKRPWEMILCIHGFSSNSSGLQFEWAWQHPRESLAVRKAAADFKSLSGIANKIKLAYMMLTLPAWQNLNLTINFFSTKYMKFAAGCPSLPSQKRVCVSSMDELPCYTGVRTSDNENDLDYDQVLDEDELEAHSGDMPAIRNTGHDYENEAANEAFSWKNNFNVCSRDNPPCNYENEDANEAFSRKNNLQVCSKDNPPCNSVIQVSDDKYNAEADENVFNDGHQSMLKNSSTVLQGCHNNIEKSSGGCNQFIEDFDFKDPPSTPEVQSFLEFSSYDSRDEFWLNEQVNIVQPLIPEADDHTPINNISPMETATMIKTADGPSVSVIDLLSPECVKTPFRCNKLPCQKASTLPVTIDLTNSPILLDE